MQPHDPRSRFDFPDIREFYRRGTTLSFNDQAHVDDREAQHARSLVYTSTAEITTDTGTPFYPTFGGRIVGWRAGVAAAPTTAVFQTDVLLDGVSALGGEYVEVPVGSLYGYWLPAQGKIYVYPDSRWQLKVAAVGGATGPYTVEFRYLPG